MQTKSFLLIALLALCSAGSKMHAVKRTATKHANEGSTFFLEYTGNVSSPYENYAVDAKISMDTTIGFRYDVTFQNGGTVLSHIAIFYKFSSPYQTIFYNYLNHKTEVINQTTGDPNNNVSVVGTEQIDSFSCTHLRYLSKHESDNYWMSTSVPGFSQLSQTLKSIDLNLMASINETIFNWGGLVRLLTVSKEANGQITFVLNLIEAETGLVFDPSTFEVPTN